jgi:hypothetical protein
MPAREPQNKQHGQDARSDRRRWPVGQLDSHGL